MELILKWTDIVFLPHWTAWSWIVTVINLWSRTSSCWWWMQQVIQNYSKEPSWVGHFWFNKFLKFRSLEPKENLNDQIMNYKLCSCIMQTLHVFQMLQLFRQKRWVKSWLMARGDTIILIKKIWLGFFWKMHQRAHRGRLYIRKNKIIPLKAL